MRTLAKIQQQINRLWPDRAKPVISVDGSWQRLSLGAKSVGLQIKGSDMGLSDQEFEDRVLKPAIDLLKAA